MANIRIWQWQFQDKFDQSDTALRGRLGRYPREADGGPSWTGLIMDTNPPPEDHWWYQFAELGEWRGRGTGPMDPREVRIPLCFDWVRCGICWHFSGSYRLIALLKAEMN